MSRLLQTLLVLSLLFTVSAATAADPVDNYILEQMRKHHITGLSLAIIQDGKIVKAKGYGVPEQGSKIPVTPATLFQAGSISKSVAAMGALHLVEQGRLSLDADVNTELASWKVPENTFTQNEKVTLRRILSHNAGLTVHGFPGYATDASQPTLVQVLDGEKPANTSAIRVETVPGSVWNYSGGGYTIMQQMVLDATGRSFPEFMHETVLRPLGMTQSTYAQPLPPEKARQTATGYYADGSAVKGRWHIYPEMAAAGLWTTASDLARFAIGVQQSLAGTSNPVISQEMTRQMVTDQKQGDGLGVFLESKEQSLRFSHSGRDAGFDAYMMAYARTGQGAVIMMNANEDSGMGPRILQVIGETYHWPDFPRLAPPAQHIARVSGQTLTRYTGYYKMPGGVVLVIAQEKGHLLVSRDSNILDEFQPESETTFYSRDFNSRLTFDKPSDGLVSGLVQHQGGQDLVAPRIGPLSSTVRSDSDPDPSLTARVRALLDAWKVGGQAVAQSPYVTPVVLKNMSGKPDVDLTGFTIAYITNQDLHSHPIERNGSKVSRVLYYRLLTGGASHTLLVYLTADGLVTDMDIVGG